MKRITPAMLAAFSVFALSFSLSTSADNTDNDGFIVFEAQPAAESAAPAASNTASVSDQSAKSEAAAPAKPAAKPAAKPKAKRKAVKKAKRAKRVVRKKRSTRKTRTQRRAVVRKASTYRVRKGDNLYRISKKFGVDLNRLARMNNLHGSKKNAIQAGQVLRLR